MLVAVALAAVLAACTPHTTPTPAPTSPVSAEPTGTPTATAPVLVPEGTAADNLPYFSSVVARVWAGPDQASGRAYVDALVAAGFSKAAMQVTQDLTTIGNPAESMQVAVHWGDQCLVGQFGPATGQAISSVLPGLGGGGCLVGTTRTIDW